MDPVDLGLHLEVLAAARLRVEPRLLPDHADRPAHAVGVANDVETRYTCLAVIGPGQRREDLYRGRLAGPIRAEQPEDRPGLHLEAEPGECRHVAAVSLLQVRRVNRLHLSPIALSFDRRNVLARGRFVCQNVRERN